MQKEIRLYIISYAFYEIARTIPHAFVTAYLLTMGLNISQITFAQVFFMIAIVVLEIPSGMICDRYNKKYVFITAYVFMICSYYIYASVNCLFTLIMAQIFYGIAMSLKSGSIDCIILNRLYLEQKEKIEDFIRWNNLTGTLSMLIGASIGSFLYTKILNNRVYFVAIAFF